MYRIVQCSPMFAFDDPIVQINKIFILFITIAEIVIILLLRVCSILKNHDIETLFALKNQNQFIKKEMKHNQVIFVEDLVDSDSQTNINISNGLYKQKKTLTKPTILNQNIFSPQTQIQPQSLNKNHSESPPSLEPSQPQTAETLPYPPQKWFINIFHLKLTLEESTYHFNTSLGLSFICFWAVSIHFPFAVALFCTLSHLIIFLIALLYNMFQPTANKKINLCFTIFIAVINILLLNLTVIGLKQSYFNTVTGKC